MAHLIQAGMRSTHSPYAVSTRTFTLVLRQNRRHVSMKQEVLSHQLLHEEQAAMFINVHHAGLEVWPLVTPQKGQSRQVEWWALHAPQNRMQLI